MQILNILTQSLCALLGNKAVGSAVEAVAADAVLGVVLIGDSIYVCLLGHLCVESSVKYCNLGNTGHNFFTSLDACEVCGVVQRRKGDALFDCLLALFGDENGLIKLFTAGNNAVTNSVDLLHFLDNAALSVNKHACQKADSVRMVLHGGVTLKLFAVSFILILAVDTDSFAKTLC